MRWVPRLDPLWLLREYSLCRIRWWDGCQDQTLVGSKKSMIQVGWWRLTRRRSRCLLGEYSSNLMSIKHWDGILKLLALENLPENPNPRLEESSRSFEMFCIETDRPDTDKGARRAAALPMRLGGDHLSRFWSSQPKLQKFVYFPPLLLVICARVPIVVVVQELCGLCPWTSRWWAPHFLKDAWSTKWTSGTPTMWGTFAVGTPT